VLKEQTRNQLDASESALLISIKPAKARLNRVRICYPHVSANL
jgi:hypothetical protein